MRAKRRRSHHSVSSLTESVNFPRRTTPLVSRWSSARSTSGLAKPRTVASWLCWPETLRGMNLIRQPRGYPIHHGIRTTRSLLAIDLLILTTWESREPSQSIEDRITGFISSELGKDILSSMIEHRRESRDQLLGRLLAAGVAAGPE